MANHVVAVEFGGSDIQKDLGSEVPEVWVTVNVAFEGAILPASPGDEETFLDLEGNTQGETLSIANVAGVLNWKWNPPAGTLTPGTPIVAMQFYTVEMHLLAGTPRTVGIWINGASVGTISSVTALTGIRYLKLNVAGTSSAGHVYYDNFKAGTTRGGTDIFSDTFEGDLSGWTDVNFAAIIVDPGIAPAVAAPAAPVAVISSIEFSVDRTHVYNAVLSTPQGIADANIAGQQVADTTSIAAYGVCSLSFENLLTQSGLNTGNSDLVETKLFATYYVTNYKNPRTRIDRIELRTQDPAGHYGAAWWAFVCGVEIGDVVTVITTHPSGGGFHDDYYVEGVHYEARPMTASYPDVTLTLDLSPRAYFGSQPSGI